MTFAGQLVDRSGAQRALALGLLPIFSGLLVLAFTDAIWTPDIYLALTGASLGCTGAAAGAIWPERYGVRHLGAIRSVAQAAMVLSTALSPILMGSLLDAGMSTLAVAAGCWGQRIAQYHCRTCQNIPLRRFRPAAFLGKLRN